MSEPSEQERIIMQRWASGEITPDEAVDLLAKLINEEPSDPTG